MSRTSAHNLDRALDQLVREATHHQLQTALDQLLCEAIDWNRRRERSGSEPQHLDADLDRLVRDTSQSP